MEFEMYSVYRRVCCPNPMILILILLLRETRWAIANGLASHTAGEAFSWMT